MQLAKYQALGNDYLVVEATDVAGGPSPSFVRLLCDRHFGAGGDGLLVSEGDAAGFALRIFNPDGSEAEKSGNGLRIHARYLFDRKRVGDDPFEIRTAGGVVRCRVSDAGGTVRVSMGRVSFSSRDVPVAGPEREVLRETLEVGGERLEISAATVGNPHCVVLDAEVSADRARELGPRLERHPAFPRRTNVQLVQVLRRDAIHIEIWERGAGYTLASGTSSCAAAAVCHRLGLCDARVTVGMSGGSLLVEIADDASLTLTGPVRKVWEGHVSRELLDAAS